MASNGKAALRRTDWKSNPRWAGITRPYSCRMWSGCAAPSTSSTPWRARARSGCGTFCRRESYVPALGAMTGQPGGAAGESRLAGHLRERLAGRGRCQ